MIKETYMDGYHPSALHSLQELSFHVITRPECLTIAYLPVRSHRTINNYAVIENTYSDDDGPEASCENTRTVHVDSTSRDMYRRDQNVLNTEAPFRRKLNSYWRNKLGSHCANCWSRSHLLSVEVLVFNLSRIPNVLRFYALFF